MKLNYNNIDLINWKEFKEEAQKELDGFEVKNLNNTPIDGKFLNICCWSDVLPCLILEIKGKTMIVEELDYIADHTMPCKDMGHQDWIIYRKDNAPKKVFTLRKNGRWVEKGSSMKNGYRGSISGSPRYYYDWEF